LHRPALIAYTMPVWAGAISAGRSEHVEVPEQLRCEAIDPRHGQVGELQQPYGRHAYAMRSPVVLFIEKSTLSMATC
jgi:hypothetical protein